MPRRRFLHTTIVILAACTLTATLGGIVATPATASSSAVVPINLSAVGSTTHPNDTDSVRLRQILRHTNQFALTTWYNETKNFDAQTSTYLSFGGTSEHYVRPVAAQAFGLAASLKLNVYQTGNNSNPSPPTSEAKTKTIKLISSVAYRHVSNTTGGWGVSTAPQNPAGKGGWDYAGWQTAHWAAFAGFAGWLMWDDLSTTDREYVRKMVEFEANRFNEYSVPYYRTESGTFTFPGDTKGEENAWNAQLLHVATAMMPDHANHATWMRKSIELMISATARPADVTSTTELHGKTVAEWVNGSNANNDGTMVNHDRVHPDYMETIAINAHAGLAYSLADKATPKAAMFNADRIYDAFVDLNFVSGEKTYTEDSKVKDRTNASPGGTIYIDDSDSIYYPHGNDWGTGRRMQFATMDVFADTFGFDSLASQKGSYWEPLHAKKVIDMQKRHTDRKTYAGKYNDTNTEDSYQGREEWVSHHAGWAYLARWIDFHGAYSTTNATY